jgi:hypothetical protein
MRKKEHAFVRDVTAVLLAAKSLSYRSFAARLGRVEGVHIQQLKTTPYFAREVRRRIAELLLLEATQRPCSYEVCRTRMRQLEALGFTDIETKAFHCLMYARAARHDGHFRTAHRVASEMVDELNRSLRRRRSLLARANLKALQGFLAQSKLPTTESRRRF